MSEWWRRFRSEWLRIETLVSAWLVLHLIGAVWLIRYMIGE